MKEVKERTQKLLKGNLIASGLILPFGTSYGSETFYTIKKGDHLSKVAKTLILPFGNLRTKEKLKLLKQVNPQIRDFNLIYPGQKINLPVKDEIREYMSSTLKIKKKTETVAAINPLKRHKNYKGGLVGKNSYLVKKGDTLSEIAEHFLGRPVFFTNASSLKFLMKYNPHVSDPNKIEIGQKIVLPSPEDTSLFQLLKKKNKRLKHRASVPKQKRLSEAFNPQTFCSTTSIYRCCSPSYDKISFKIEYPFSNWKNKTSIKSLNGLKFKVACI